MTEATKWVSAINALLGAWLVVSPFALAPPTSTLTGGDWNNVVIGIAVFLIAGYNYYRQSSDLAPGVGSASLVVLLGLWTLVAPFVVFPLGMALFWSNVLTGALVTILGVYVAFQGRRAEVATPRST